MTSLKKIFCCFALIASAAVSQAHGWHGFGCHGYGFTGHGYGFGLNHHSFSPSVYNPGWSSYSRASFYSSYGYAGLGYRSCWPRVNCFYSYRSFAPVYYNYYVPTYYAPVYYPPAYYNTYVAPVIYSNVYSSFPSCSVTPTPSSVSPYAVRKPVTNSVPFRLASQPTQSGQLQAGQLQAGQLQFSQPVQRSRASAGHYVLAQASSAALDTAPEELIAVADAILAAGGFRQAAQAYAQIVVKHGNSDRLVTRRFIAQVANGDFEQAAVVVELAAATGNSINLGDVPQGNLQSALGDSINLIATRCESLAANALQKSDDAIPMLTVAHWLALSGDQERADLFKARAEQMKQVEDGEPVEATKLVRL
jgi:hypothetical protein